MPKKRQSWVNQSQFTPQLNSQVDFEIDEFSIPVGSTLLRTWIDVRFNRIGFGDPPEFVNQAGPTIWGVCFVDPTVENPGVFADDDAVDWLWRESVTFGPAAVIPQNPGAQPEWEQVSVGPTGLRDSKGQRKFRESPGSIHWCMNTPHPTIDPGDGMFYEIFIHTLWLTA